MGFLPAQSSEPFELGVVICTYNVKEKVLENIQSVLAQETTIAFKVLVVDSGSTDGTLEAVSRRIPEVLTHRSEQNIGCAVARNIGMKAFVNQDVLLLDSDLVLEKDAVEKMALCRGQNIGQICGHLYSIDQSPQCTAFRKPNLLSLAARLFHFENYLPESWREKYSNEDLKKPLKPFWSSGGFTWVTHRAIGLVGGRDEDFFVYGEDVEHAHRMQMAHLSVVYTPEARALHYGSSSTRQNIDSCREDVYKGLVLYWKKCQPRLFPLAFLLIMLRLTFVVSVSAFLKRPDKWDILKSHYRVIGNLLNLSIKG